MATPESIVVSLEKAKELKAHGWPQADEFSWKVQKWGDYPEEPVLHWNKSGEAGGEDLMLGERYDYFPAPSAEEILRRCPQFIVEIMHGGDGTNFVTILDAERKPRYAAADVTLANALAETWCYLKENNLC